MAVFGVGVAAIALALAPAGRSSSEKSDGAGAAQLPQDNSPPPDEETIRQVQRERAAQRPNIK